MTIPARALESPPSFRRLHLVRGRWSHGTWKQLPAGIAGACGPAARFPRAGFIEGMAHSPQAAERPNVRNSPTHE